MTAPYTYEDNCAPNLQHLTYYSKYHEPGYSVNDEMVQSYLHRDMLIAQPHHIKIVKASNLDPRIRNLQIRIHGFMSGLYKIFFLISLC